MGEDGGVARAAGFDQPATPPANADRPATRPGTLKATLAAETLRLYAGDWARFQKFCGERATKPLPAPPELVAAFLAAAGGGRTALARRLAAIDHQHRTRGLAAPGTDASVRAVLRRARRAAPRRPRPPPPSVTALERMAQACRNDLAGQRDRALLLLLAAGLGRGEIVALQAEQLRFTEAGLAVPIGSDASAVTTKHLPRLASQGSCPVRALEAWLRVSATRYGPVFRKINRWGQLEHAALGADAIRLILARRALPPGANR